MVRFKQTLCYLFWRRLTLVSIPRWFDSSKISSSQVLVTDYLVSIPRWFDSSRCNRRVSLTIFIPFQFHDGSIQAFIVVLAVGICYYLFQFHDGSIQAGTGNVRLNIRIDVSIPRWFDSSQI